MNDDSRPLIVSIGAEVDASALEREIRAEAARKERHGVYPTELLERLVQDPVRDRIDAVLAAVALSCDAPTESARPGLGRAISLYKRAVAMALRWHTRWLVGQFQTLGGSMAATAEAMSERMDELERRQRETATGLARLQAAMAAGGDASRVQAVVAAAPPGPVACLGCDAGLLAELGAAGVECVPAERSLEVAAPGSLSGVVGVMGADLDADEWEELLRHSAAALAPGGLLLLDVPDADPLRARALGAEVGVLAEATGLHRVAIEPWPLRLTARR